MSQATSCIPTGGEASNLFANKNNVVLFAGPCSIESEQQFAQVAECVSSLGLHWIRGGAFKPRTNPHSFQGLGEEGLQIMQKVGSAYGLQTLTEVVDSAHIQLVSSYTNGLQIGTRNMANYSLLSNVGKCTAETGQLVLLKRGMAATISEWLQASDYLTMYGNTNVVLCERGLRTFETATRYTLDISAVPVAQSMTTLPLCVDVSHPAGLASYVPPLAKAALAVGAQAIMIEIHPNPAVALSDGPQQLNLQQFQTLVAELRELAAAMGKTIV